MGILKWFGLEKRQTLEEILINGGVLATSVSKAQALNIPSVAACVELICSTVASLPIQLYKENDKEVKPITDPRVALLNDDTGDTLDGYQWKRSMVEDYLLAGGAYSYIKRARNTVKSIHFVENSLVGVLKNADPIDKRYQIQVNGALYRDFQFIKLLRKTKDGAEGYGIVRENNVALSVAYNSMIFHESMVKTGGSKKGFIKAQNRLSKDAIDELKLAWANLYANNNESNVIVLNNGLEFQEASQTSVELQLNEHTITNSAEICKLFLVPPRVLSGEASEAEYTNWIKTCILPILAAFETALNRDMLLPSEKEKYYFSFDVTQLLKGSIEQRFMAYQMALNSGFMQIDEIRYKEDLPPLNLNWIKLGLQDVLYFPESEEVYTPNTNKLAKMGEEADPTTGEMGQLPAQTGQIPAQKGPDNTVPPKGTDTNVLTKKEQKP
jgi:HK97 family phage portal protein